MDTQKYSKDGAFSDPVVRCDSCSRILGVEKLHQMGSCLCGSRKVRNVLGFTSEEKQQMEDWGIDGDFLALFEATDDAFVGVRP